jgi:Rha family phage regulatory protein
MFDGAQLATDTRVMATTFGKQHKDVLRAYDNLKCSAAFSQRNFAPAEFVDGQGKLRRFVTVTKDGFTMLAMGFTGRKAKAFNMAGTGGFGAWTLTSRL